MRRSLSLLASLLFAGACGGKGDTVPADTAPADDTASTAADDTAPTGGGLTVCETGIVTLSYVGEITTTGNAESGYTFESAEWGYALRARGTTVCELAGSDPLLGEGPANCPGWVWSFQLAGVEGSTAEGEGCAGLGLVDGQIDGYFDYAFGYAPVYYYDYNGTPLAFEHAVFAYVGGEYDEWYLVGLDYKGRRKVTGDANHLAFDLDSYRYYYSYYYSTGDCD